MKELKPQRTITIIINDHGYTVQEGDLYHDELCWDEMLGTVVEMTHPAIGRPRYQMMTTQGWQKWREYMQTPLGAEAEKKPEGESNVRNVNSEGGTKD